MDSMENIENKYYDISFDDEYKIYVPLERKYMRDPNNINNYIIHTVNGLRTVSLEISQWDTLGYIGVGLCDWQMKMAKVGYDNLGYVVFKYKKYCQEFCDWLNNEYINEKNM